MEGPMQSRRLTCEEEEEKMLRRSSRQRGGLQADRGGHWRDGGRIKSQKTTRKRRGTASGSPGPPLPLGARGQRRQPRKEAEEELSAAISKELPEYYELIHGGGTLGRSGGKKSPVRDLGDHRRGVMLLFQNAQTFNLEGSLFFNLYFISTGSVKVKIRLGGRIKVIGEERSRQTGL
ncbi:transcription activator BRG1 isoform X1 [Lates japonicus]|uniref:Transcription activator BRG1 isoform X1 n=1 Tax=Lates japonicus TaxID=270547 RepID=A0AAD3N5H9_LATJO|nr:transcription activator BRG1 isoform X1 [Lates japonicus]